jgi:inosine-uridine nucleoside N-ribohydrolase
MRISRHPTHQQPARAGVTRRHFLAATAAITAALSSGALASSTNRQPVILDTDIGDDIDDTWALLMLLRMPNLDLKLAVGDFGNAIYRARLLAKLLEATGRSDVPVGIGIGHADEPGQQSGWIGDYQLSDYPGLVHTDGVQAIIDTIKSSPEPVTLICLGPVPNIAEALRRDPSIASNAKIVGMYGSIYKGYLGASEPAAEYNVRIDPQSLQSVFAAPWECTITPLDTCGLVVLDGENYRVWLPGAPFVDPNQDTTRISTTLFDTVAVYLVAGLISPT